MTNRRATLQGIAATLGALSLSGIAGAANPAAGAGRLPGSYVGTLEAGPTTLRLQLVITSDGKAQLVSLDQGNAIIPASSVIVNGNRVTLAFAAVNARYEATLIDPKTLSGTFTQGASFPLRMVRGLPSTVRSTSEFDAQPLTATLLAAHRAKVGTPGLGVGWQSGNKPPQFLLDGKRGATDPAAVTVNDKWHLGSNTKSMTATLVARAVEAGLVSWTTTVDQVFALDLKDIDPAYHRASLLHLLSHHSGLPKDIPLDEMMRDYTRDGLANPLAERRKMALRALSMKPDTALGAKLVYSNNGYIVAGAMLEKLIGKSWEDLLQRFVFDPLGITSAGFGPPGSPQNNDQPSGHQIGRNSARISVHLDNVVALGPAGRVHMSLPDYLTYLRAHRDRNPAFLGAETWQKLHTPPYTGQYALGWFVGAKGSLWHNGSNGVWLSEAMIDRETKSIAAFVSNDAISAGGGPGKVLLAAMRAARKG